MESTDGPVGSATADGAPPGHLGNDNETATAPSSASSTGTNRWNRILEFAARAGVLIALIASIIGFGLAQPDTFLTLDNLRSILLQSSAPAILAIGLTVPLVMRDFDLSIGSMLGLGGASAVALMSLHGVGWFTAIIVALLLALLVGLINGFLTAYLGASSFIITLAMGTILIGVEFAFTNQKTLYQGVAADYLQIGQSAPLWGINIQVWIALLIAAAAWVFLEHTETGRFLYAIGGNPSAARFAGIGVRRLRMMGFVIVALAAAVAGILITAQSGASSPQAGIPYLLPAYAAAFLGSAAFRPGEFNIAGTVVGAIFLTVIQTGLQILQLSTAFINVVQGVILILAVLLSRLERNAR